MNTILIKLKLIHKMINAERKERLGIRMDQKSKISIITTSIIVLILFLVASLGFFSNFQLNLSDYLHGSGMPLKIIKIVAIDDKSLQELGRWPWDRDYFANLINKLDTAKVVGIDVAFYEKSKNDGKFIQAVENADNLVLAMEFIAFNKTAGDKIVAKEHLLPIAGESGYVNFSTDKDGVTRRLSTNLSDKFKSFSQEVYNKWSRYDANLARDLIINFSSESYDTYSFSDIINGKIEPNIFAGKIVLVGATAQNLHDNYFVPVSKGSAMPGVVLHANAVQNLITKRYLRYENLPMTLLNILIATIFVYLAMKQFGILTSAIMSFFFIILYMGLSIAVFNRGLIMNLVYVPLSVFMNYFGGVASYYFVENKQKLRISKAFSTYVSPIILKEITQDPTKLKLGGHKREITIFFSDIRDFTSISESLDAETLVKLLNGYLTAMSQVIFNNHGLIDKYMGDAIMAFWNAPLTQEDHADLAAKSALEMSARLQELHIVWQAHHLPMLNMGIGLNTGVAIAGNMGSDLRFDFTAIGDSVNLGSRLEGLNKYYNTHIIIGEYTKEKLSPEFATRELDRVLVKGKYEPVTIHELVGYKHRTDLEKLKRFEEALYLYYQGRWQKAGGLFSTLDDDPPAKIFHARCNHLLDNPPPGWDGVWEMTTK